MSTAAVTWAPTTRPTSARVGGLLRAEVAKLTSTRTAGWLVLSAAALSALAVSGIVASGGVAQDALASETGVRTVLAHGGLAAILPLILGVLVSAGEYRHGTVVDTFLTEPRRGRVVGAKLVVGAGVGLVVGVLDVVVTAAAAAAWYAGKDVSLDLGSAVAVRSAVGVVVWTMLYGAIGVAVGSMIRTPPAAIVAVVVWLFIAETAVAGLLVDVGRWLPGTAASALGNAALDGALSQMGGGVVLLGWTAVAAAGAFAATARRDVA
jgi:ABC-2 type transport system permease protein